MGIVQVTFLLAIWTFILALFAAASARITAWMAWETRKLRRITEERFLPDIEDIKSISPMVKG